MPLKKIFLHDEDKNKVINIIQQGYYCHLDPIEEEKRKSDLDEMIIRGKHKSSHSVLNSISLDKSISKDIEYGWAFPLTIESLQNPASTIILKPATPLTKEGGKWGPQRLQL